MMTLDYAADAPHFDAWAGRGERAQHIHNSGDREAMTELAGRYNREIAEMVADGTDAMADIDVEALARDVAITWSGTCRTCRTDVTWSSTAREPRETEAPLDASGDVTCDACEEIR